MAAVTTCPQCGACYEETSEEAANSRSRLCGKCLLRGYRSDDFGNVYLAPPPCDRCGGTGRIISAHLDGLGRYRTVEPCPVCKDD